VYSKTTQEYDLLIPQREPSEASWHIRFRLRNTLIVLLGSIELAAICSLSFGYIKADAPISWGIVETIDKDWHLPFRSGVVISESYKFVSVTPAGVATGLQVGDVIDMTRWTLRQRLAFAYPAIQNSSKVIFQRGSNSMLSREGADAPNAAVDLSRISDIALRLLLLCSGLVIIRYGRGLAALGAGGYLVSAAVADSFVMTFAGLPAYVQAGGLVLASVGRLSAYTTRFLFAMQLLRVSHRTAVAMWCGFAGLLLLLLAFYVDKLGSLLLGHTLIAAPFFCLPVAQILMQLYAVATFGAAALMAPRRERFVFRIIFFATLVTVASYVIQACLFIAGGNAPSWLHWYFNTALVAVGIGYPWAFFARRIAGVDFIISRGVAYAISIAIVVIAINLLETLIEQVASGWIRGIILDYGAPVVLGLSFNWIQGRVTLALHAVLDHDLFNATRALNGLKAEMVQARTFDELPGRVSETVARLMRASHATVYGEHNGAFHPLSIGDAQTKAFARAIPPHDPAAKEMQLTLGPVELRAMGSVLGDGLLLPLVVLGRVVGALHCGTRPYNRSYDRAERAILEEFARELAIAFVCFEQRWNFRELPPYSPPPSV
jgi:hypothetical protein